MEHTNKARTLNTTSKILEQKLSSGKDAAQKSLKSIYTALDHSKDIAEVEASLKTFLTLKSDARALLTYFRHNIASVKFAEKPDILGSLDVDLVEFDRFYEKFSSVPGEMQTEKLFGVMNTKDKALFRIANSVLENLGMDHVVREFDVGCDISMCSSELTDMFSLFETFRALGNTVKRLLNAMDNEDLAADLSAKQVLIGQLQTEVALKDKEIFELGGKLRQLTMNTGRQQVITRQLEEIQALEAKCRKLTKETTNLTTENRELHQSIHHKNDRIQHMESQLSSARSAYETDILKLQPVVERQVRGAQVDRKEIADIRNKATLTIGMMEGVERRAQSSADEAATLRSEAETLRVEMVSVAAHSVPSHCVVY